MKFNFFKDLIKFILSGWSAYTKSFHQGFIKKMMFLSAAFLVLSAEPDLIYAQVENVPSENKIYNFLEYMWTRGVLENYSGVVLPLMKKELINDLHNIEKNQHAMAITELSLLNNYLIKYYSGNNVSYSLIGTEYSGLINQITEYKNKHLYNYSDSSISLRVDPVIESKYIYSSGTGNNAWLLDFGGRVSGSIEDWLGFYFEASNGVVRGNRNTALSEKRLYQNYTYSDFKLNYFDETVGYIQVNKGPVKLQLGRERLLFGSGSVNRFILSENPPLFDFIKLNISYKSISYNFIHGWLVQKPDYIFIDSLSENARLKPAKYIAISRFGFKPSSSFELGLSQLIIYGNRPFEAAYLNPFLFWESAQRSMNEVDNSYLLADAKWRIISGIAINSSLFLDDINLEQLSKGNWDGTYNRLAWQVGTSVTYPYFFSNALFDIEYMQVRPFVFSHYGLNESLTFSSNGYLLGTDLQPNSTRLSLKIIYWLSSAFNIHLQYHHTLHGRNVYNAEGEIINNVGGDFRYSYPLNDDGHSPLLDGSLENSHSFVANAEWEILYGIYCNIGYQYFVSHSDLIRTDHNILTMSFNLDLE